MQDTCADAWQYARGEPLIKDQEYEIMREYWFNGEGWLKVRNQTGRITDAPDVFFTWEE